MISFLVELGVSVRVIQPNIAEVGDSVKQFVTPKHPWNTSKHHIESSIFVKDDLLLFQDGGRKLYDNFKLYIPGLRPSFKSIPYPKNSFTQTLSKKMALLRGGLFPFVATVSMLPGQYAYLFPGTSLLLGPKGG